MIRVRPFKHSQEPDSDKLIFWCPGCEAPHWVRTSGDHEEIWGWNGDLEYPTFYPSAVVSPYSNRKCHFTVVFGMIQFHGDCWHLLAGRTAMLPAWEGYDPKSWRDEHRELFASGPGGPGAPTQ